MYIRQAISLFNKIFIRNASPIHKQDDFGVLAKLTRTTGDYKKTLILKASAAEECDKEYKVHLVPYFESHENECNEHYHRLHDRLPDMNNKGGLLGWLGKRESEVDSWGITQEKKHLIAFEDTVIKGELKIHKLAEKLRKEI